jgi:hypothetical protein
MPNPVPKKYTVQLGPTFTPDTAGELAAWAETLGMSVSAVTRTAAERGLESLRGEWAAQGGRPAAARVAALVEEAARRGEDQAGRRTRSDRSRRNRSTSDAPAAA